MSTANAIALALLIPLGIALSGPGGAQGVGPQSPGPLPDFAGLDTGGDGRITAADLRAFAVDRLGDRGARQGGRGARLQERLEAADANGDGVLCRAEMIAAGQARVETGADRLLRRLDTDGDDAIAAQELVARPSPGAWLLGAFDTDGDAA